VLPPPAPPCPRLCSCNGSVVDCSGVGLTEMPRDVPPRTAQLLLAGNAIEALPAAGYFDALPELTRLDLTGNHLRGIPDGAFRGAEKLQEL